VPRRIDWIDDARPSTGIDDIKLSYRNRMRKMFGRIRAPCIDADSDTQSFSDFLLGGDRAFWLQPRQNHHRRRLIATAPLALAASADCLLQCMSLQGTGLSTQATDLASKGSIFCAKLFQPLTPIASEALKHILLHSTRS